MYTMTLNGKDFFYPANEKYTLTQLVLHEALNDAGYLDVTVPSSNPQYNSIEIIKSKVDLQKDGKTIFRGYVVDSSMGFDTQKDLYIVGELSYLANSVQVQQNRKGFTRAQLLETLLNAHNAQSEEKFYPGVVTVTGTVSDGLIDYSQTLDAIKTYVCASDGYLKIRYANNRRYLDVLKIEDYGKRSNQYIRFGANLLDYAEQYDGDSILTAIIPTGAKLQTSEVEGLDAYLTIESVNGGNKVLKNQTAVDNFGFRCKTVNFDTEDVNTLYRLAKAYLTRYQYAEMTLELSAVDLSMIDSSQDDYSLGDYVRCTAEPFEMDSWFPVNKKDTNILDLSQNVIVLGASKSVSLTGAIKAQINGVDVKIPQSNSLLETAKRNASEIINTFCTGYVTTRGHEITIADHPDITKATKIWRWNMGGLGYSKDGGRTYGTAITMDGSIVADYITSGEMSANRIRGGQLLIGGSGIGKNGEIVGYTENNQEIFKLNKDGGWFKGDISAATLSGGAGDTLNKALQTANNAIATAQGAANTAQTTASNAATAAAAAQSSANSAASAASAAQSTASSAASAASAAQSAANSAQSTASSAASAASAASSAASSAQSTANSAASAASSAASAASSAASAAAEAKSAAAAAQSTADTAWKTLSDQGTPAWVYKSALGGWVLMANYYNQD